MIVLVDVVGILMICNLWMAQNTWQWFFQPHHELLCKFYYNLKDPTKFVPLCDCTSAYNPTYKIWLLQCLVRWTGLKWLFFPTNPLLVGYETHTIIYEIVCNSNQGGNHLPCNFWSLYNFLFIIELIFLCSLNDHIGLSIMFIFYLITVIIFWAQNPISIKHMFSGIHSWSHM